MTFFLVAVALFVRAGRVGPTRRQPGRSRFFRSSSRQNRMAAWENSQRNLFIMAVPQEKAALTPKPATLTTLGKFEAETFILAITLFLAAITSKLVIGLGKHNAGTFIMAIAKERAIGLAKQFGLAKSSGLAKP